MNVMSFSENTHIFNERLNFFRFICGHYDLENPRDVDLALEEFRIRLKYRSNMELDNQLIFRCIRERGFGSSVFFDEVYKYFLIPLEKSNWGEYANLNWRNIPTFLEMFPNGKVILVIRDLRAILSSFKTLTFLPGNNYLNLIFNWIDCVNYIREFEQQINPDQLHLVRLEDLHADPEKYVRRLIAFTGEAFQNIMLEPEKWREALDERFNKVNLSAHTGEKVYGFDPSRSTAWLSKLDKNIIELAELLAGNHLKIMGYELTAKRGELLSKNQDLLKLVNEPLLINNLKHLEATD